MIIGLSGVAGSGKDLFFSLLKRKLPIIKTSLAESLKRELSDWSREHYGIDPLFCSREEKNIIRPLLVFHGVHKRHASKGRHWIKRLELEMNGIRNVRDKETGVEKHVVITDIRYDEYKNDEVSWLKDEMDGILVHISQYRKVARLNSFVQEWTPPANSEEERNDPRLKEKADYSIEWEWEAGKDRDQRRTEKHENPIVSWLNGNGSAGKTETKNSPRSMLSHLFRG